MATLKNICPYDSRACVQYLDRLVKIEKMFEYARRTRSQEIFFSGEDFPGDCPLNRRDRLTCVRYQIHLEKCANNAR